MTTAVANRQSRKKLAPSKTQITPADVLFNPELFASYFLKILDKQKQLVPLNYNRAQQHFMSNRTGRDIILKARQLGFSTAVQGELFRRAITSTTTSITMAHDDGTTQKLRRIQDRFWEHCVLPNGEHPIRKYSNATLVTYPEFDSTCVIATAGSKEAGRGDTYTDFHGCLSPDTMVVTPSHKLVRMGDMQVGNLIVTHTGQFASISYISKKKKNALKVTMQGMHTVPLIVTPEHKVWTRHGMVEIGKLSVGDQIGYPVRQILDYASDVEYRLPDTIRPQGGIVKEHGPVYLHRTYEIGRILGFYLAEGCIKRSKSGKPEAVILTIHEHEMLGVCEWLDELNDLFRSYKVYKRKNSRTVDIVIGGKSFANFVLDSCSELGNKRIPYESFSCGVEFARGLVHGYLLGDGCFSASDRKIVAGGVRSSLTIGIRDLIASLGYGFASIGYREAGTYKAKNSERNGKESWLLRLYYPNTKKLFEEVGYYCSEPSVERKQLKSPIIENGYAWISIDSIEQFGETTVMDFEINHADHSYCILQGAVSNSEVAFWTDAEKILAGAMQGGNPDIVLESTPNGTGGWFYDRCMEAINDKHSLWKLFFYPWWWDVTYKIEIDQPIPEFKKSLEPEEIELIKKHKLSLEQIAWRRFKKRELKRLFPQEYPESIETCFLVSGVSYFGNLSNAFKAPFDAKKISTHKYSAGLDWGKDNDYTSLTILDVTKKVQVDYLHVNKLPWGEIRRRVAAKCKRWGIRTIVAESNSIGDVNIEELRKLNLRVIPFNTTNESKGDLMSDLYDALHEKDLKLLPIEEAKHEFDAYTSTKLASGAWRLAAAGKGHDDFVISTALAWKARRYAKVQIWV